MVRCQTGPNALALYNTHCTDLIGTANVHTLAERRRRQDTRRSTLAGSFIRVAQLDRDNSARQDQLKATD